MRTTTFVLACLLCAAASAQEWIARYSSGPARVEAPEAVAVNDSGEIFVAGYARGLTLIKYSCTGETMWVRTRPRPDLARDTNGVAVACWNYGNVLVAAGVRRNTLNGFRFVEFTRSGACQYDTVFWHYASASPAIRQPLHLRLLGNSVGYVLGTWRPDSTNSLDAVLCKFNSNPRVLWTRCVNGPYSWNDYDHVMNVDDRQNIHIGGETSSGQQQLAYATKYDSSGRQLWRVYVGNESLDAYSTAIAATPSATYLVGMRQLFPTGLSLGFVTKYNSNGGTLWSVTDTATFYNAVLDTTSGLYVAANRGFSYDRDLVTLRYNVSGQLQWKRTWAFAESTRAYPRRAMLTRAGDVVVAGDVGNSHMQRYLGTRYTSSGSPAWTDTSSDLGLGGATVTDAVLDSQEDLILTGYHVTPAYTADWVTMKFHPVGAVAEPGVGPVAVRPGIGVLPAVTRAACRITAPGWDGPLVVADQSGRVVRTLAPGSWDLCDGAGRRVADGVYFILAAPQSGLSPARLVVTR